MTDGAVCDQLPAGLQPTTWGASRAVTVPAGAVLLLHQDLWHRQQSNVAADAGAAVFFKLQFARTQEPVAGAPPSWRHSTRDWLLPASLPDLPNLRILWESVWRWYCGVADTTLPSAGPAAGSEQSQVLQTLLRRLGWEVPDPSLLPMGARPPPAAAAAGAGDQAALQPHAAATAEKLAAAQLQHAKAQARLQEYQQLVDGLLAKSVRGGGGGEAVENGNGSPYDEHDIELLLRERQKAAVEKIMTLQEDMAKREGLLSEQKAKEALQRERTKTAKAEAIRLRRCACPENPANTPPQQQKRKQQRQRQRQRQPRFSSRLPREPSLTARRLLTHRPRPERVKPARGEFPHGGLGAGSAWGSAGVGGGWRWVAAGSCTRRRPG